jgi:hypothetical protein
LNQRADAISKGTKFMRKHLVFSILAIGLPFAVGLSFLAARPAAGESLGIPGCHQDAARRVKHAKHVRELGGCGLNLADKAWSTNPNDHFRWCMRAEKDTVIEIALEAQLQASDCTFCDKYALAVTKLALDNIKFGCGLTAGDGRWKPDYDSHVKGCMGGHKAARDAQNDPPWSWNWEPVQVTNDLKGIIGDMQMQIDRCKEAHTPRPGLCKTCHETQKPTALLPAALRPPPKRGRSHDFSVARQPPSIKQGTSSGQSDKAQPSGERRRTPSGSSTSAMDRLGGGGMGGAPSGGGQSSGRSAPRPSAGGGASSGTPSGRAPSIGTNTILQPGGTTPGGRSPGLR